MIPNGSLSHTHTRTRAMHLTEPNLAGLYLLFSSILHKRVWTVAVHPLDTLILLLSCSVFQMNKTKLPISDDLLTLSRSWKTTLLCLMILLAVPRGGRSGWSWKGQKTSLCPGTGSACLSLSVCSSSAPCAQTGSQLPCSALWPIPLARSTLHHSNTT